MKLLLKILALPVILILNLFILTVNVLVKLSAYILSPLVLVITGCLIYCIFKVRWKDIAILTVMEALIFGSIFAAGSITCMAENACEKLTAFIHT